MDRDTYWDPGVVPDDAAALVVKAAVNVEADLRALPVWHATPAVMGLLDRLALLAESDRERARVVEDPGDDGERITNVISTLKDELTALVEDSSTDRWRVLAQKIVTALDGVTSSTKSVVRCVAAERNEALRKLDERWEGVSHLRRVLARQASLCNCVDRLVDESRDEHGAASPAVVTLKNLTRLFAVAAASTHDVDRAEKLRLDVLRQAWRWQFAPDPDAKQAEAAILAASVAALAAQDPGGSLELTTDDLYQSFDNARTAEA